MWQQSRREAHFRASNRSLCARQQREAVKLHETPRGDLLGRILASQDNMSSCGELSRPDDLYKSGLVLPEANRLVCATEPDIASLELNPTKSVNCGHFGCGRAPSPVA